MKEGDKVKLLPMPYFISTIIDSNKEYEVKKVRGDEIYLGMTSERYVNGKKLGEVEEIYFPTFLFEEIL